MADLAGVGGNATGATPAFAVFESPILGSLVQADIDVSVTADGYSSYTAATVADFDGDGLEEVAFYAASGSATSGHGTGVTGVFEVSALSGRADMGDATLVITGTGTYDGVVEAGDTNADGYADLLTGPGPVGLFLGDGFATTGVVALTDGDAYLNVGGDMALMDGDTSGSVDLVVVNGGVFLFPDIGSASGTVDATESSASAIPDAPSLTLSLASSPMDDDGEPC